MPLKKYVLLKGVVIDSQKATSNSPHYQIRVVDDEQNYRISVNVRSKYNPKDLRYVLKPNFQHPLTSILENLPLGISNPGNTAQERKASGFALDYIRTNLFDPTEMKEIPSFLPGPDNDLNELVDKYVDFLMGNEDNRIYAFGEPWHELTKPDKYFGFLPGNGIHDIHMNQGNLIARHKPENGVYQDGGLIFYLAEENRYIAYFTMFQSQVMHTDDIDGHPLSNDGRPTPDPTPDPTPTPDNEVRIIAAMVNPVGGHPEKETVTLLNTTNQNINLQNWHLADKEKNRTALSGTIDAGAARKIDVKLPMQLSNKGGIITLLNQNNLKVHGVSYSKSQAGNEGQTIVFS